MAVHGITFVGRVLGPLAVSVAAYLVYRHVRSGDGHQRRDGRLLSVIYVTSRLGLWLVFAIYAQQYVTSSDPRSNYTPMLEHLLAGDTPIRDFFYPYGPILIPSMLPFYLLLKPSLAGISLFAILAEAVALGFLLKSTSLLQDRGEIAPVWVIEALALYLLNPGTLYWTVFQGYHSIVQTAYSMAAWYYLLRGRAATGYAVGFYGLAGSKALAVLDWPGLMAICRPRLAKVLLGTIPLLCTYVIFQVITGDVFFPLRYHMGYISEGNVWYLTTWLGGLRTFYLSPPGSLVPYAVLGSLVLLGLLYWARCVRLGPVSFSFQAAAGLTTFTVALFLLAGLYTGDYYIPMLMLPASLVVTCPIVASRYGVWSLLLISSLSIAGDAIWTALGQPVALADALATDSLPTQLLAGLWTATMLVRIACFAVLAHLGLRVATTKLQSLPVTVPA
jgi:hypothetical protein